MPDMTDAVDRGQAGEAQVARRALVLLDLTSLNEDDTEADIAALCRRATTPEGDVAAVCIYPRFVRQAKAALDGTPVRVATVVNFPAGNDDAAAARAETEAALAAGADEIDVVLPYQAYLAGRREDALRVVDACREACGDAAVLKVILETGRLEDPALIRAAAADALGRGAGFVKTSTGKVAAGATPEAARAMLEAIRDAGGDRGFKASGGVRTTQDASLYMALADEILGPGYLTPERFRFGASSLLDDLLAALGHGAGGAARGGY
jgi:deoxyribose-phosphate aldolase